VRLPLNWLTAARKDLLNIAQFIAEDSPTRAKSFVAAIETKVAKLPDQPTLYRIGRIEGTREMVVHPNYVVVYRIAPSRIDILRVMHVARRWPSQLP
jgi:addiction module RelE/StbE family toxin